MVTVSMGAPDTLIPWDQINHGTRYGYLRCKKHKGGACPACLQANADESAIYQRRGKQRPTKNGYTVYAFVDPRPWMGDANCQGVNPELFYPGRGDSVDQIKAVCADCVCRDQCLDYALEYDDDDGIWGGTTGRERRIIRRRRRQAAFEAERAERESRPVSA